MAEQGSAGAEGAAENAGSEAAEPATAVDLSPVLEQLGQIGGRLESLETGFQQFGGQEQQQEGEADAGFEEQGYDDLFGPDGSLDGATVSALMQQMQESGQESTQKAIQEALAPIVQRVEDMQIDNDAASLIEEFPEFSDPQVAETVVNNAFSFAKENGIDMAMARRPGFIAMVHKAQKYDQHAAGETPVGQVR